MRSAVGALALAAILCTAGCGGIFLHTDATHTVLSLSERDLQQGGMALLTPSTVTGKEEDKQALAQAFFETIGEQRPDVRVLSLARTLSAINRADLVDAYERMFVASATDTGIFKRDILRQLAGVTDTRYLAQLKLASFRQTSLPRWSFLGVRILETKRARVRLFLQVWDSHDGDIAWEGSVELVQSIDTGGEREVTLRAITQRAAVELVRGLPGGADAEAVDGSFIDTGPAR